MRTKQTDLSDFGRRRGPHKSTAASARLRPVKRRAWKTSTVTAVYLFGITEKCGDMVGWDLDETYRIVGSGTSKQVINLTKRSKRNTPRHRTITTSIPCAPSRHVSTLCTSTSTFRIDRRPQPSANDGAPFGKSCANLFFFSVNVCIPQYVTKTKTQPP